MKTWITAGLAGVALAAAGITALPAIAGYSDKAGIFDWAEMEFTDYGNGGGGRRDVFEGPTGLLDRVEIHITTLMPGDSPHPPHTHDYEEIIVIKEGTVVAHVDGEEKLVGPGSIIICESMVPHTVYNTGDVPATYHVISWSPQQE